MNKLKIRNIVVVLIMISFVFCPIRSVFSQKVPADKVKRLSNKADSIYKKYYEYSTFSQNGMNLSEGYTKKFRSLFSDDALLFNDLDFDNKNSTTPLLVDEYIRNVKIDYLGGLGVEITEPKIGEPVAEKNNYTILVTGKKKVFGFHETKGKFSNEYNFVLKVQVSLDYATTKIVNVSNNQNNTTANPVVVVTNPVEKPITYNPDQITCIVKNEKNELLKDVKVIMKFDSDILQQKYSKSNGEVNFANLPADGEVEIIAEEMELYGSIKGKISDLINKSKDIIMKPKQVEIMRSITIALKDMENEALPNAKIILKYNNEIKQKGLSNDKGEFLFTNIPAGTVVYIAAKIDEETGSLTGKIDDLLASNKTIILKDERAPVTLSIFDSKTKEAISNAKVRLLCEGKVLESYSDNSGKISFKGLSKNKGFSLSVSKQGYKSKNKWVDKIDNLKDAIFLVASGSSEIVFGVSLGSSAINNKCFEIRDKINYINGSTSPKFGFGFSLTYSSKILDTKFIDINVGAGIGVSHSASAINMDSVYCRTTAEDIDYNHESYERRIYASGIKENVSITSFDIPVFVVLKYKLKSKFIQNISLTTGVQLSFLLSKKYSLTDGSFTYRGYYNHLHAVLYNLPEYGFGENIQPDRFKSMSVKTINFSYFARLGVSIPISSSLCLRPAFDICIGLSNLSKASADYELTNTSEYIINDYNSILNYSKVIKTFYYGFNLGLVYKF